MYKEKTIEGRGNPGEGWPFEVLLGRARYMAKKNHHLLTPVCNLPLRFPALTSSTGNGDNCGWRPAIERCTGRLKNDRQKEPGDWPSPRVFRAFEQHATRTILNLKGYRQQFC
jgi:hypothetical protein